MKGLVGITVTDLANEMLNQRKKERKEGRNKELEGGRKEEKIDNLFKHKSQLQ